MKTDTVLRVGVITVVVAAGHVWGLASSLLLSSSSSSLTRVSSSVHIDYHQEISSLQMITKLAVSSQQQQQQQQQQHETNKDNDNDTNTTDTFTSSNNNNEILHSFFTTTRSLPTRRRIIMQYAIAAAAVTTSSILVPPFGCTTTTTCWAQEQSTEEVRLLAATREQLDVVVQACSVQAWPEADELVRGIDLMGLHKLVHNNTTFLIDSGNNNDIEWAVTGIGVLRTQLAAAATTTTPHTTVTNDDAIQIMTIGTDSRAALERFMVSRSNNNYDEDGVDE